MALDKKAIDAVSLAIAQRIQEYSSDKKVQNELEHHFNILTMSLVMSGAPIEAPTFIEALRMIADILELANKEKKG